MTRRLVDLMCFAHRAMVINTGLWPTGYRLAECPSCTTETADDPVRHLPGIGDAAETAVHEAGHAFGYLWAGVEVMGVALERRGDLAAYTNFRSFNLGSLPELTGLWAGVEASRELVRRLGHLDDAAEVDVAACARTDSALILSATTDADLIQEARDQARRLVARRWDKIQRVASGLIRAGRLDATQLDDLCFPSSRQVCAI